MCIHLEDGAGRGIPTIAQSYTTVDEYLHQRGKKVGLDAERLNLYREYFGTLRILVRTWDFPDALLFVFRAKGLCVAGTSSGYVYSPVQLSHW